MAGVVYTASFIDVAITATQDLMEILCPTDACLEILSLGIGQKSDVGDAAEEILLTTLRMVSGAPTSGSGGSTATPRPHHLGAVASGCTVEINNTTQISGGTNTVIRPLLFNVRIPDVHVFIPEERIVISPGTRLVWELDDNPVDSITTSGWISWREIGG